MAKKKETTHVLPEKGWAVKKSGSHHAIGYYKTQKEAIKAAEAISKKDKVNLIIFESRLTTKRTSKTGRFTLDPVTKKDASIKFALAVGTKPHKFPSSPQQQAEAWRAWAASHESRRKKPLSDEAISRESIYEDRW